MKSAIDAGFLPLFKRKLDLPNLGLSLQKNHGEFILQAYPMALRIKSQLDAKFYYREGGWCLGIDGIYLPIETAEDLFIIHEIYLENTYGLNLEEGTTIIDIGMNVGFASVFFASKPQVQKVYTFEPVPPTYKRALEVIEANPDIAKKIETNNLGLANEDGEQIISYLPQIRGRVGVLGTKLAYDYHEGGYPVTLQLKKAHTLLAPLLDRVENQKVVVKMDCEGAEYPIIEDLAQNGILSQIHAFMIEWHEKGPAPLVNPLQEAGFSIFSLGNSNGKAGMIYAVRPT